MEMFKKIWSMVSPKQRDVVVFLFVAVLFNSVLEFFGLGLIMPLIALVNNPELIRNYPWVIDLLSYINIVDPRKALILFVCLFMFLFVFKSVYVVKMTQFQLRFTSNMLHDISCRLLKAYLFCPWTFHLQGNSAKLLNNMITQASALCTGVISSMFAVCTEMCIVVSIILLLIIADPISTLIAIFFIGFASLLFLGITHRKTTRSGADNQRLYTDMIRSVNEALGGIKETKIMGREAYFVRTYATNNRRFTRSWVYLTLINTLQRSIIEILFVCGIMIMSLVILARGQDSLRLLSMIALFTVAAFRLMPSMNRINTAIAIIKFYRPALDTIHNDINNLVEDKSIVGAGHEQLDDRLVRLNDCIELQNVSFKYPNTERPVLSSVNLVIPKGLSVGFIGKSGAGKTTAVDIILGLLKPDSGKVLVDRADISENLETWRRHIGYIPQTIYLSDNSIRRNIAFGLDDSQIDNVKVWEALKNAQLYDLVKELPEGLDTFVGERGVRLSGGQRQRIGIARAIYHDPDVLVMDEATSSLDAQTEKEVAEAVFELSGRKTVIIIAHRLTTVAKCDVIYEFKDGNVFKKKSDISVAKDDVEQERFDAIQIIDPVG